MRLEIVKRRAKGQHQGRQRKNVNYRLPTSSDDGKTSIIL